MVARGTALRFLTGPSFDALPQCADHAGRGTCAAKLVQPIVTAT